MMNEDKYPTVNPYIGKDGKDYSTTEALEKANREYEKSQKLAAAPAPQAAKAGIPRIVDPEQAAYEEMMNQGYPAAREVPPVVEHPRRR